MFQTVFSFLLLPLFLLPPPPLFSFIYLRSDCVCCLFSFSYLLCVRACSTLILFCCSSCFLRLLLNTNSLIYSQLQRGQQNVNSSILFFRSSFRVLVCSYLHGCCVRVWFSSLLIIVGFLDAYSLYICVCVCFVCAYQRHRETNSHKSKGSICW